MTAGPRPTAPLAPGPYGTGVHGDRVHGDPGHGDDAHGVSAAAFKDVFRRHPAGVAVVAFRHEGRPVGFTATSVISVSAEPPVVAFSIAGTSSSWPALAVTGTVAVSFLGAEQADVSSRFATSGIDRFAGTAWHPLPTGEPVLQGASAWLRGAVVERVALGSSHLVAVRATSVHVGEGAAQDPLVYHDRVYHRLGEASAI